mmetsp:Transcript_18402/g.53212  ORF Transcript_18402/g.53212 Transcript_18402/m.53212 type:complete len:370 (-) Transcript_18402:411-1520(-)
MSGIGPARKTTCFSSSVSSTTMSSSTSSSSLASAASSSSAFLPSFAFRFFSSMAFLRSFSCCLRARAANAASFFSASISSWTFCLNSAGGSPMITRAVFLNPPHLLRWPLRPLSRRFARNSGTRNLREVRAAKWPSKRRTDPSSIVGRPNFASGLSFDGFPPFVMGLPSPLFPAHSMMLRSLISSTSGCSCKNIWTKSKYPWPGKPIGKITSPCVSTGLGTTSTSAFAASLSMRHLKGIAAMGSGPKFTSTVTFLYEMCGKSVLPSNCSGIGCGSLRRTPSRKRLTVLPVGPSGLRFTSSETVESRPNFCAAFFLLLPKAKKPSESKKTLVSSPSASCSEEPASERPMRTKFRGWGTLPSTPCCGSFWL